MSSNPPSGDIIFDGSGVFTSSGTNATLAISTNGVMVNVAATNVNFVKGTNIIITATNVGSVAHVGFHSVTPPQDKSISVKVNGAAVSLVATQVNFVEGLNITLLQTNSPSGNVSVGINTKSNLIFYNGSGAALELGTWGNVFGISNRSTTTLLLANSDPAAGDDVVFGGLISAVNANLSLLAGTGDYVAISPGGTLLRTNGGQFSSMVLSNLVGTVGRNVTNVISMSTSNATSKPITNSYTDGVLRLYGIQAGANVTVVANGTNYVINAAGSSSVADPNFSIQFNSNGVMQGSENLLFTNGMVYIDTPGASGSTQLRLDNSTQGQQWDLAIDANAETYYLGVGRVGDASYAMVWEVGGNVGIGTTNPINKLDIEGRVAIGAAYSQSSVAPTDGLIVVGNVGFGTASPTNKLDVWGHVSLRTNLFLPNLPTNASPVAFLAIDAGGMVYETAVPAGDGGITSINGDTATAQTISLNTNLTQAFPHITNSAGLTLINLPWAAANVSGALHSNDFVKFVLQTQLTSASNALVVYANSVTNATIVRQPELTAASNAVVVLTSNNVRVAAGTGISVASAGSGGVQTYTVTATATNALIQTNGVNVGSIGTLNWTAGITGSVSGAVVTLGASAGAGGFSVSGNSNQIPYLNQAGTAFVFGGRDRVAPGFGFSKAANGGIGGFMIHEDETNVNGLVAIGPPNPGSSITKFVPSLSISNRYDYDGATQFTQEMIRVEYVDVGTGSSPQSFAQIWRHTIAGNASTVAASLRKDGLFTHGHGTLYKTNNISLGATAKPLPLAAEIGHGGYWVGNSNGVLIVLYSVDGTTTAMKVLAP